MTHEISAQRIGRNGFILYIICISIRNRNFRNFLLQPYFATKCTISGNVYTIPVYSHLLWTPLVYYIRNSYHKDETITDMASSEFH